MYIKKSLKKYLEDLASVKPAPGGGSASALIGALGVAELLMVCAFTLKSSRYKKAHKPIKAIQSDLRLAKKKLTLLIDEDIRAYAEYRRAADLSVSGGKKGNLGSVLKNITEVPLRICRQVHLATLLIDGVARNGNPHLRSDIFCAYQALVSAFESAKINVVINLSDRRNPLDAVKITRQLAKWKKDIKSVPGILKKPRKGV